MKATERDTLLGRLDERSLNTWKAVDEIKKHLETLNNNVSKNTTRSVGNKRLIAFIGICVIPVILKAFGVY